MKRDCKDRCIYLGKNSGGYYCMKFKEPIKVDKVPLFVFQGYAYNIPQKTDECLKSFGGKSSV